MDADLIESGGHQLTGGDVAATIAELSAEDRARLFAVACTAGTTNLGIIDDMQGSSESDFHGFPFCLEQVEV